MKKLALSLLATGLIGFYTNTKAYTYEKNDIKDYVCTETLRTCFLWIGNNFINMKDVDTINLFQNTITFFFNGKREPIEIKFNSPEEAKQTLKNMLLKGKFFNEQ
ncbi:hypothetical protein JCM14244_17210 [Venenivibrio stagnispumantis]|uniref:Uncharacterized protein n=1 Tax=Venenivibrio stagnispumantis TaxID=407998 RepID=A0AA46AFX1_9AQUI|nr:hypothetical protein [Venenivibrio stagnispumantis]MCW4573958.1 hypothetical protein [Venenivibrio stagnispumantis]SMP22703.1 hypothetical protein SAMN06264868_12610 [Venenivibrio stagnispumantis]